MALRTYREFVAETTAFGAFNVNDQVDAAAVIDASRSTGRLVVLLISPRASQVIGLPPLLALITSLRRSCDQFFVQLDHWNDVESARSAAQCGIDGVMFDYSRFAHEDNLRRTRAARSALSDFSILIEGAVGVIGDEDTEEYVPSVEAISTFVRETGVDLVSIPVGTRHGFIATPQLDRSVIDIVCRATAVPVCAHGCDFLSAEQVDDLITSGVRKLNFGPQLRVAYLDALDKTLPQARKLGDHRLAMVAARKAVALEAEQRIAEIAASSARLRPSR